jgi:hypothetical protein
MTRQLLATTIALGTLLALAACSNTPSVTVTSLATNGVTVAAGGTAQLTVTATMSDGTMQNVTAQSVFTSANSSVATVSASGLVDGVSGGSTSVTVTCQNETASAGVVVVN